MILRLVVQKSAWAEPLTSLAPATFADLPALVDIGEQFFRSTGMVIAGLSFDRASMEAFLADMLDSPDHVLFVARDKNTVVGVVGGFLTAPMFNRNVRVAQESFWYVSPESRKTGVGEALYRTFAQWAEAMGAVTLVMATVGDKPSNDRIHDRYIEQGFQALERHYFKPL